MYIYCKWHYHGSQPARNATQVGKLLKSLEEYELNLMWTCSNNIDQAINFKNCIHYIQTLEKKWQALLICYLPNQAECLCIDSCVQLVSIPIKWHQQSKAPNLSQLINRDPMRMCGRDLERRGNCHEIRGESKHLIFSLWHNVEYWNTMHCCEGILPLCWVVNLYRY